MFCSKALANVRSNWSEFYRISFLCIKERLLTRVLAFIVVFKVISSVFLVLQVYLFIVCTYLIYGVSNCNLFLVNDISSEFLQRFATTKNDGLFRGWGDSILESPPPSHPPQHPRIMKSPAATVHLQENNEE